MMHCSLLAPAIGTCPCSYYTSARTGSYSRALPVERGRRTWRRAAPRQRFGRCHRPQSRRSSEPLHLPKPGRQRVDRPPLQTNRDEQAPFAHAEEERWTPRRRRPRSISAVMARGVITASWGRVSSTAPHPEPGEVRIAPPAGGTFNQLDSSATRCAPHRT